VTHAHVLLQSFDLQRVLEGEKALRSEATRQLKEVEKKLVSLRSPAVALSSPMPAPPGSEQGLEADKAMLQDQIKAHSAQVTLTWPAPAATSLHPVVAQPSKWRPPALQMPQLMQACTFRWQSSSKDCCCQVAIAAAVTRIVVICILRSSCNTTVYGEVLHQCHIKTTSTHPKHSSCHVLRAVSKEERFKCCCRFC